MKSLKGHFMKTNILMVLISAALVIIMSFIFVFIFSVIEPKGFERIMETAIGVFTGKMSDTTVYYFIVWALVTGTLVLVTCMALTNNLAKSIIEPVTRLKKAAEDIADGELNFDVLTSEDGEELSGLCNSIEKIRCRLKENAERELAQTEERNMLIANFSHDMRTPVTTIKGYIDGIHDGIADTPEKQKKYLDTIYSKAIVLEKLLDNITMYSELECGRMQYVLEYIDITEYLKELAYEYESEVGACDLGFEAELSDKSMMIVGDRNKLKRVLDNLVSNAVKYNKEGGSVILTQETDGKGVLISVSDTGLGIAEKDINKVFDGFYRGDRARSNIKGNGLGLAIAKQIVESHHGKIWIKSIEKAGTQVFIYLPLRDKER